MELANGKVNKFFTLPDDSENRYYIADFDADKDKNNNVYLLCEHIPDNSIVIDVACGSGKFGRKLKEKNCILYGLERDAKATECARSTGCYREVFECDITEKDSKEYKHFLETVKRADIIILSDILEHLVEPTSLLLDCNELLKKDGHILVSVPNIAHSDIVLNLLNGNFNYTDMGILDNTHLKFFTKYSFFEWIDQINNAFASVKFDVEYLGGTFYSNEFIGEVKEKYKRLFELLQYSDTCNNLQLLFKLDKIDENQIAYKLQKYLSEKDNNVVELLGKSLEGETTDNVPMPKMLRGERENYELQIEELKNYSYEQQKYISKIEEDIRNQQVYIESLETNISEQQKYIETIDESLVWYKAHTKEMNKQAEEQTKYIVTLEESLKWHQENIAASKNEVAAHLEHIKELKESIEWHQNHANREKQDRELYITTLEESLNWYKEERENKENEMSAHVQYISQLEEELKMHKEEIDKVNEENMLLNEKMRRMENSIFFKLYKIFGKN